MRQVVRILALGAVAIFLSGATSNLWAQGTSGSTILRSQDVITWWVVDEESGHAAFFGGDIAAICRGDKQGYDLLDFQTVEGPDAVATLLVARGDDIGASLWEQAPTFAMPQLCHDVLASEGPIATGTARLTITGRFPTTWGDGSVAMPFGLSARGTLLTPTGVAIDVTAMYRCRPKSQGADCTQRITEKR